MERGEFDEHSMKRQVLRFDATVPVYLTGGIIKQTFYKKNEKCSTPGCGTILRETQRVTVCSCCIAKEAERLGLDVTSAEDMMSALPKLIKKLGGQRRKPIRNQRVG